MFIYRGNSVSTSILKNLIIKQPLSDPEMNKKTDMGFSLHDIFVCCDMSECPNIVISSCCYLRHESTRWSLINHILPSFLCAYVCREEGVFHKQEYKKTIAVCMIWARKTWKRRENCPWPFIDFTVKPCGNMSRVYYIFFPNFSPLQCFVLFDCKDYWGIVIVASVNKTDLTTATRQTTTDATVIGCPMCLEIQTVCGSCIDFWRELGCYTICAQFLVILCCHEWRDKHKGHSSRRPEFTSGN